ncbi:OmpA family protein [Actinomadura sp. NPDC000600]|uniref:OmpA family protein n=1 Tax=Actinomadura sp. NPDC000600 TaxID=3154262 RepID=UPI00339AA1F2
MGALRGARVLPRAAARCPPGHRAHAGDDGRDARGTGGQRRRAAVRPHTDGRGAPSYNQSLSERRAAAVRDALRQATGGRHHRFQVAGKAADEPIAEETTAGGADNPAGRARNRRVEISYSLRTAAGADRPTGTPGVAKRGETGPPSPFRGGDGPVVAERTATEGVTGAFLSGTLLLDESDLPQRTYMYVPAPPRGTTRATLDAGPFGKIPNVPLQGR